MKALKTIIIVVISFFVSLLLPLIDYTHSPSFSLPGTFWKAGVHAQTQVSSEVEAEAKQWLEQGQKYYRAGNLKAAFQAWEKALKLYQELNNPLDAGGMLTNLGIVSREMRNYNAAFDYFNQALLSYQKTSFPQGEALVKEQLGIIYGDLGHYEKALQYFEKALEITKSLPFLDLEAQVLNLEAQVSINANRGIIYIELSDYDNALNSYQDSKEIAETISNLEVRRAMLASVLHNLGAVHQFKGELNEAVNYYQQSLEIARKIGDQRVERSALGSLGLVNWQLGNYPEAVKLYEQSLALAEQLQDPQEKALALTNLGRNLLAAGKLQQAEKQLRASIQIWESIREELNDSDQISIFDKQLLPYYLLQQVLVTQNNQGKLKEALEIAERGRNRAFIALLSKKLETSSQPLTLEQIQQLAKTYNTTLVEYSLIPKDDFIHSRKSQGKPEQIYIWVIQPTGKITFRSIDLTSLKTSLNDLVTSSRLSIGIIGRSPSISIETVPRDENESKKSLQQLHQILINPIADLLPSAPNAPVIFMPQGQLFLVPFPALQDDKGKYLIEKHTILTAPAIQVLNLTQQQRFNVQQANLHETVVVGNPTMPKVTVKIGEPPQQLPVLPGAEQEAKKIAQLLHTKAITGKQATKVVLLKKFPKARIIHLATHGLLDDFKGLGVPGAIALAPSSKDDGLLTSSEILDLKLHVELVVLSACDTGRGDITGDGVIGLSRSLILAGTPSVIVSLWSVPDAPTAELMTEFYRNWQEKKLDKAQALRQAMLTIMKTHPNPRDWAAFTLIGEAE